MTLTEVGCRWLKADSTPSRELVATTLMSALSARRRRSSSQSGKYAPELSSATKIRRSTGEPEGPDAMETSHLNRSDYPLSPMR
ncbi:hypothetical protein E1292_00700 [Nonomuraea deserti]|uniref:Uncharacterized protein n=1 Tax=Nonomuraea deserti TaxID=1848322 RepID=A0A4R4W2T9_9ACTN|nr:hypothetical protein [Nonomuraea deserti]TDD12812.1 hypothetical protein E1292_00700 [Nonomuraea deserti]